MEPINRKAGYEAAQFPTREEVMTAMDQVAGQAGYNMEYFGTRFLSSATKNQAYRIINNIGQADGFWTRLLWLCYEYTGEDALKELALKNVGSFLNRVEKRIELDHHDLGFLYGLSRMAGYELTGSEEGREAGLLATDKLMKQSQEKGGLIQAWGKLGAGNNYHPIIDCLLSTPLLHWASLEVGNPVYRNAVLRHYEAACNNVIRDDAFAYHALYFDPETGEPPRGITRQGYSDGPAWARGQTWGIYGILLNYRYVKDDNAFILSKGMTNYFLSRFPENEACYWGLISTDGSEQPRGSSAVAIGMCSIHEAPGYLSEVEPDKDTYCHAMHCTLHSLMERYTVPGTEAGNPVLLHGVHSWHSDKGMGESNIRGDYYYTGALMWFYKDWNLRW